MTTLKDRVRAIRPEYAGIDPVDRVVYQSGEIAQCDLWSPAPPIPVAAGQRVGQERVLPLLERVARGDVHTVFEHYKGDEWERFCATVSDWDVKEYLDILP